MKLYSYYSKLIIHNTLTPNNIYYTVKISFILTEYDIFYTYFFTKYDGNADDLLLRATELQNLTISLGADLVILLTRVTLSYF
jgi:hypothetical protein